MFRQELHDDVLLMIVVAELSWGASFALLEDAVEVGDVVKATAVANLDDSHGAIGKKAGCMTEADIDDILRDRLVGTQFEETAECRRRHRGEVSKFMKANLIAIVSIDEFLDLLNTTTICSNSGVGESAGRKEMIVAAERKFVHKFHELQYARESRFSINKLVNTIVDMHDGFHAKSNAHISTLNEIAERLHRSL